MSTDRLADARLKMREAGKAGEAEHVARLVNEAGLDEAARAALSQQAERLVEGVRDTGSGGMLEGFLAAYSLSTHEGIALMCLAEALLRAVS